MNQKYCLNIFHVIVNANLIVHNVIETKNGIKCRCECKKLKKYHTCKKYFIWNPGTFFFETGIYLKSIVGDSIIACNEIRNVPVNSDDKMP